MTWTAIGAEYAIEWMSGAVTRQPGEIDLDALERLARDYIESAAREPLGATFSYTGLNSRVYRNLVTMMIDYVTY